MKENTIIIVDDHLLFAQSLVALISKLDGYRVVDVFKNGKELVDYYERKNKPPDLVLLDIKMPVMDGIKTIGWLKTERPRQKVLALTMEDDEDTIIKMVKLGARGYLLKDIHPDNFQFALRMVIQQGFYNSSWVNDVLNNSITENGGESKENDEEIIQTLTKKEYSFLMYSCSELTYKEIAVEMELSPKTIENHRLMVYRKLNVKSRVGLVLFCVKNKLFKV